MYRLEPNNFEKVDCVIYFSTNVSPDRAASFLKVQSEGSVLSSICIRDILILRMNLELDEWNVGQNSKTQRDLKPMLPKCNYVTESQKKAFTTFNAVWYFSTKWERFQKQIIIVMKLNFFTCSKKNGKPILMNFFFFWFSFLQAITVHTFPSLYITPLLKWLLLFYFICTSYDYIAFCLASRRRHWFYQQIPLSSMSLQGPDWVHVLKFQSRIFQRFSLLAV